MRNLKIFHYHGSTIEKEKLMIKKKQKKSGEILVFFMLICTFAAQTT